jgi:UDP-N-acetylglucosamine/UDP-N-acetylgalactosamine diphosphorylase
VLSDPPRPGNLSVSLAAVTQTEWDPIRAVFERHGQGHVFQGFEALGAPARAALLAQARGIDLEAVAEAVRASRQRSVPPLSPAPVDRLVARGGDPDLRARAGQLGRAMLAEGAVAVMVMAGGQGTRLGFAGPKGCLPLGPVTQRTLFELQAQKLRGLERRCGKPVPWLVMTSPATDPETRAFFARHAGFGLARDRIHFFRQGTAPSVDLAGRLLRTSPGRIAESPDGHGGALPALVRSGLVELLRARGIRWIQTYQVDNPLVRIGDPVFLGLHRLRGAQMSCKVVEKATPDETAGTVGLREGRTVVVEYTEIDRAHREAREPDGSLRFWAASIGMHVIDLDLVERVGSHPRRWLPLHASAKKIPQLDPTGRTDRTVVPDSPNGYKLERFVFDALGAAETVALLEVERSQEYAPIKRPAGEHSPETARAALSACARRWLEAAGIGGLAPGEPIELDHARIDSERDAAGAGIRSVSEAPGWILRGG